MHIGVAFPGPEMGVDPVAIRDYAQAAEELGYDHLLTYEHVLGVDPTSRPELQGLPTIHEPFVLFGYLAAFTRLELITGVLILPQRQTALVAKQAAEVDLLTGGKLRLGIGVGWNDVEYEALDKDFHQRGRIIEEQVEVLRLLWSKEVVNYTGTFHTITHAGINPLPVHRSIPIWMGGNTAVAMKRVARLGDGWLPLGKPDEQMHALLEQLRSSIREAGRDPDSVGIEGIVNMSSGNLDELVRQTNAWHDLGATHVVVDTLGLGYASPDEHIEAIRRYKEAIAR